MKLVFGLISMLIAIFAFINNMLPLGLGAVLIGTLFLIKYYTSNVVKNKKISTKGTGLSKASSSAFVGGISSNSSHSNSFGDSGCGGSDGGSC
jgi:hypothetical protein